MKPTIENILDEYGPMMARIIASYERDTESRRDLLQDVAIAVWRALPGFREDGSLKAYVARIARNRCVSHVARAVRAPVTVELPIELVAQTHTPEQAISQTQEHNRLVEAVRALPLNLREVVVLALEGFRQQEIADTLGISLNAATLRYRRAKQSLKEAMTP